MLEITLIRNGLEEEFEKVLTVEDSTTVDEVLELEGIAREEVLVSRNGAIISGKHELDDGDELEVLDVIAGG